MITVVNQLPAESCKSLYSIKFPGAAPSEKFLNNFLAENKTTDVFYTGYNFTLPQRSHKIIVLVVNHASFIAVDRVSELIEKFSTFTDEYLYVAVNKFLLYSDKDRNILPDVADLDEKLVRYFSNLTNFTVIHSSFDSNDHGQLGNFIHPVTQLLFKRNG